MTTLLLTALLALWPFTSRTPRPLETVVVVSCYVTTPVKGVLSCRALAKRYDKSWGVLEVERAGDNFVFLTLYRGEKLVRGRY